MRDHDLGDDNGAHNIKTKKFQRYVDRLDSEPFLRLLASNQRVTEREAMLAYGLSPETKSWPAKLSTIASKARRELRERGIVLAHATCRGGWSLTPEDRQKLGQSTGRRHDHHHDDQGR
jgi:hypothetical protein